MTQSRECGQVQTKTINIPRTPTTQKTKAKSPEGCRGTLRVKNHPAVRITTRRVLAARPGHASAPRQKAARLLTTGHRKLRTVRPGAHSPENGSLYRGAHSGAPLGSGKAGAGGHSGFYPARTTLSVEGRLSHSYSHKSRKTAGTPARARADFAARSCR